MRLRTLTAAALLTALAVAGTQAQNAVVANASRAMGVDTLTSITFSGTARNGAFGQSKALGDPLGTVNNTRITQYTRTITFAPAADPAAIVSRAFGPTQPAPTADVPTPMPGQFQQNITGQQATGNFGQALNILTTPWGFLKAAAANNATVRAQGGQQVVTFSPAGFTSPGGPAYQVTGYINNQNLVTKVETRVENAVVGDLLVEFEYSGYRAINGVQVPAKIVQKQAGLVTFEADITAATANPANLAELLTPPPAPARGGGPGGAPPAGGGRAGGPPPAPPVEMLAAGVFKIGGGYQSLAIDMGDHILVVESGQSEARGVATMAAAKAAIPGKPIRFVTTSHGHFDHASGLAAAVAEGATILAHRNTEPALERFLSGPRTLVGDSLSKVANRRTDVVRPVGDRETLRGTNGRVVELFHVPNEHTDGMIAVYLPADKIMHAGDVTANNPTPAQVGVVKSFVAASTRVGFTDYNAWIPVHAPNPDRPMTKADVTAAAGTN